MVEESKIETGLMVIGRGGALTRTLRAVLIAVVVAAAASVPALANTAATASAPLPPQGPSPAGANNWSCKPGPAHPLPVVLVHGLGSTMAEDWVRISPLLASHGYCVFALTYGSDPRYPGVSPFGGTIPMEQSAPQLAGFVDKVLSATGAARVDLVGHSEGTVMPRYYLKFLGGGPKVDRYVGITPLWNGSNPLGLAKLAPAQPDAFTTFFGLCGACAEFVTGSAFNRALLAGGATVPGVTYTDLITRYDELVVPYTSGILNAPNVTNIVVQDQCSLDFSEHGAMAVDPIVEQDVLNALDPAHAVAPKCQLVLPYLTGAYSN
jgi:triacylglycerol lipase